MKQILLAVAAALTVFGVQAQPRWHHDETRIPDRVEREVFRENGHRVVVITTSRCVRQWHGVCRDWRVIKRDRRMRR